MKKIDGHFCRVYGSENTHLTLTKKADKFYSETDPYRIYERETEDEDGDTVYLYTTRGFTDTPGIWMTEYELNEMLEAEADEIAGEEAAEYFWDLDGWGSDYPPENAGEIIDRANEKILEAATAHYGERGFDIGDYAAALWEHYCSTGEI